MHGKQTAKRTRRPSIPDTTTDRQASAATTRSYNNFQTIRHQRTKVRDTILSKQPSTRDYSPNEAHKKPLQLRTLALQNKEVVSMEKKFCRSRTKRKSSSKGKIVFFLLIIVAFVVLGYTLYVLKYISVFNYTF
jgi:hypothetical protein